MVTCASQHLVALKNTFHADAMLHEQVSKLLRA
jgi:hypothetical protein